MVDCTHEQQEAQEPNGMDPDNDLARRHIFVHPTAAARASSRPFNAGDLLAVLIFELDSQEGNLVPSVVALPLSQSNCCDRLLRVDIDSLERALAH